MRRRLRVDLEGLLEAIANTSLAEESFLDVVTGNIISLHFNGEHFTEEHENFFFYYKAHSTRYRHIPHASPRELYHDMLAFVAGLDDPVAQAELRRALSGKAAILRFLTAVKDFPAIAEKWEAYHRRCLLERARKWLAREGFILDT
jgi:hypothetical protein